MHFEWFPCVIVLPESLYGNLFTYRFTRAARACPSVSVSHLLAVPEHDQPIAATCAQNTFFFPRTTLSYVCPEPVLLAY